MKKFLSLALLLSGISFATMAQDATTVKNKRGKHQQKREMVQKTPEEMAKLRTDRMDKELKFTDSQRQAVYNLQLKNAITKKEQMENQRKNRVEQRQAMKQSREEMKKILTPEQQQILSQKMADNHQNNKNKHRSAKKNMKAGRQS